MSGPKALPMHTMVTLLCIVSGSLDAISFLALGEAFASVSGTESTAVRGLLALATGALLGSLVLTHLRPAALLVPTISLATVLLIRLAYDHWGAGSSLEVDDRIS